MPRGPEGWSERRGRENQTKLKKLGGGYPGDYCEVLAEQQQRRGTAQTTLTNVKRKANSENHTMV